MANLKPGQAAKILGVSVKTLQRWDREGILTAMRTPTNRRYYTMSQVQSLNGGEGIEFQEDFVCFYCEGVPELEEYRENNGSIDGLFYSATLDAFLCSTSTFETLNTTLDLKNRIESGDAEGTIYDYLSELIDDMEVVDDDIKVDLGGVYSGEAIISFGTVWGDAVGLKYSDVSDFDTMKDWGESLINDVRIYLLELAKDYITESIEKEIAKIERENKK